MSDGLGVSARTIAEPRPLVVANCGIVGLKGDDELDFFTIDLGISGRFGLPKNFLPNREVATLFTREVPRDQRAAGATEIVDAVRHVLSDVNFTVRVGDFVDNFHLSCPTLVKGGRLTKQANRRPHAGAKPRMRDVRVERRVRRAVHSDRTPNQAP